MSGQLLSRLQSALNACSTGLLGEEIGSHIRSTPWAPLPAIELRGGSGSVRIRLSH